jgi:alpha-glucosidase
VILLTLRGTPLLYYGDEIGMREAEIPRSRLKDPVGVRHWPENPGRDGGRTPMQWTPDGGFTTAGVEPWLPMGEARTRNVADQREDPGSMLHLCRDLIALRREREDLHSGTYEGLEGPEGVWSWRRGSGTVVAVNHGEEPAALSLGPGEVLLGTERSRAGERVDGAIRLDPLEAVIVAVD